MVGDNFQADLVVSDIAVSKCIVIRDSRMMDQISKMRTLIGYNKAESRHLRNVDINYGLISSSLNKKAKFERVLIEFLRNKDPASENSWLILQSESILKQIFISVLDQQLRYNGTIIKYLFFIYLAAVHYSWCCYSKYSQSMSFASQIRVIQRFRSTGLGAAMTMIRYALFSVLVITFISLLCLSFSLRALNGYCGSTFSVTDVSK